MTDIQYTEQKSTPDFSTDTTASADKLTPPASTQASPQIPSATQATTKDLHFVHYAGFWIRAVADVLDSIVLSICGVVIQLAMAGAILWTQKIFGSDSESLGATVIQVLGVTAYLVLSLAYYTYGHYWYGTTLGKRPLGIYVVRADNLASITWRQAVTRTLGCFISFIPLFGGYLMVAFHPRKQALHDLMAGTVSVVRRGR